MRAATRCQRHVNVEGIEELERTVVGGEGRRPTLVGCQYQRESPEPLAVQPATVTGRPTNIFSRQNFWMHEKKPYMQADDTQLVHHQSTFNNDSVTALRGQGFLKIYIDIRAHNH